MLVLMGVVYHLSLSIGGERQSGISDLLAAQTCTTLPRILSNLASFALLYLPGWIVASVLMTQILFTRTSTILLIFLTILAGMALTCASHLCASFFRKGQMAGLYTSTLMFALAFVSIAFFLSAVPNFIEIQVLTFIFTPITYVTLISDIAYSEMNSQGYSLAPNTTVLPPLQPHEIPPYPRFSGYRYVIIFVVQMLVFGLATYGVESWLWGVNRTYTELEAGSEVTLRATHLSKTFQGRRRGYWPFTIVSGSNKHAVDDFNIELKKGSVNFLLGPNGGGKTTTLKCIAGMYSMDPGSHLEISQDSLSFGICPQLNVFWDTLSVEEHIRIWKEIKTAASPTIVEDEEDVLVECDLLDKQKAAAKTLSGGQQRKLQLAIAFVGGSKMCYIDEASSGLDPLSRRNIWNIISRGHLRRTVLMTTHFLDEADVLADHISILYRGKTVCAGTSTSLKASHGDSYIIREISEEGGTIWSSPSSADATRKILELEEISDASYSVQFPTLDQVFLKATDSTTHALHEGGDGIEDEIEAPKELLEVDSIHNEDLSLDVGHAVGFFRQILVILMKRYWLIRHTWISFAIALAIPIVIAAALAKFVHRLDKAVTCQGNYNNLHNISSLDYASSAPNDSYVALLPLTGGGYFGPGMQFLVFSACDEM
jgi:ATP-binding cassette subfamily A (ABC1) protein 3